MTNRNPSRGACRARVLILGGFALTLVVTGISPCSRTKTIANGLKNLLSFQPFFSRKVFPGLESQIATKGHREQLL